MGTETKDGACHPTQSQTGQILGDDDSAHSPGCNPSRCGHRHPLRAPASLACHPDRQGPPGCRAPRDSRPPASALSGVWEEHGILFPCSPSARPASSVCQVASVTPSASAAVWGPPSPARREVCTYSGLGLAQCPPGALRQLPRPGQNGMSVWF